MVLFLTTQKLQPRALACSGRLEGQLRWDSPFMEWSREKRKPRWEMEEKGPEAPGPQDPQVQ